MTVYKFTSNNGYMMSYIQYKSNYVSFLATNHVMVDDMIDKITIIDKIAENYQDNMIING